MKENQLNTENTKRDKEIEEANALASKIWNILVKACEEFSISQATLCVVDSNLVLSYPLNSDLSSISFSCSNSKDVLRIFSSIATQSNRDGKIYCQNTVIKLSFKY